ncbi:MAG: thioesterase family protein [Rhodobacteraceae bacterium]|nr:thioesterase family protein [Paracoccaceae bacterium]
MADLAYFRVAEDGAFLGNDPARGPWSPDYCHAGPVTGLAVRACEAAVGEGKMLTRLTLDILRPCPLTGLYVTCEVTRNSRTLATTRVEILDGAGTLCVSGSSMHLVRKDMPGVPTAPVEVLDFEAATLGAAPLRSMVHDQPAFADFIEVAYPPGVEFGPGPKALWMKTPPLVEGEEDSPIQSICALADCGNGISWNATQRELGFMNTDLTLQIHREPVGDWHAADAVSHWQENGVGMSQAVLHDVHGPVGMALQTLVLHPVK